MDLGEGRTISSDDFPAIEKINAELAKNKSSSSARTCPRLRPLPTLPKNSDPYKLELIDGLQDGQITFYTQGNFTDLCRGPHIPDTGLLRPSSCINVAGAYWRGDEKNKQLTRLYGITFPKQKELDEYLETARGSQKARPPQAGQGAGAIHLLREGGRGPAAVAAQGHDLCASA